MSSGERRQAYSLLRVIACMGIVLLHTANVSELLCEGTLAPWEEAFSMGIVYCMMWAVPCFLMVSGALLLDPARALTKEKLFGRYLRRVFIALLVCCVFFRLFDLLMDGEPFTLMFVADGVWRMFSGQSWAHLWYLYLLIGLYLFLPFYRMIASQSTEELLRYLLLLYVLFLSVLPMLAVLGWSSAFEIQTASIYPFYFFSGYAIASGKLRVRRAAALGLFCGGTAAILLLTMAGYLWIPERQALLANLLGSYAFLPVLAQSVGLFALMEGCGEKDRGVVTGILDFMDECGFGVYLIHMVFLRLLLRYWGWDLFRAGLWTFFVFAAGVFLLSCAVTALLRKIPFVRGIL